MNKIKKVLFATIATVLASIAGLFLIAFSIAIRVLPIILIVWCVLYFLGLTQ